MANGDDYGTRLARVEQRVSDIDERGSRGLQTLQDNVTRNAQKLLDLDARVNAMLPLSAAVAVLTSEVAALRDDLAEMRDDRRQEKADSLKWRVTFYTFAVMLVCALIGTAAAIFH